jgi:hypothetical protein
VIKSGFGIGRDLAARYEHEATIEFMKRGAERANRLRSAV